MRTQSAYKYVKQYSIAKARLRVLSFFFVAFGLSLVLYAAFPIATWQLFYAPGLTSTTILSPIPKASLIKPSALGAVLADATGRLPLAFDSTKASSWFPTGNPKNTISKAYVLSIPKLGIKDATVIVGADDLAKSLIHYGGSSLPGDYGNAVIFGHSILPQFFDPKNYKAIFSTLHTLKPGDIIEITADGVTYRYSAFDFRVVDPDEISVLEQSYDDSYLTVITCTPPGTYWKRLVVKAKINDI